MVSFIYFTFTNDSVIVLVVDTFYLLDLRHYVVTDAS